VYVLQKTHKLLNLFSGFLGRPRAWVKKRCSRTTRFRSVESPVKSARPLAASCPACAIRLRLARLCQTASARSASAQEPASLTSTFYPPTTSQQQPANFVLLLLARERANLSSLQITPLAFQLFATTAPARFRQPHRDTLALSASTPTSHYPAIPIHHVT
jgi:hypothetical protein